MEERYESVKVYKEVMKDVRAHVAETKQTISGFVELAIKKALKIAKKK